MNSKRYAIALSAALLCLQAAKAQTIDDLQKLIDYKKYVSAAKSATAASGDKEEVNYYHGLAILKQGDINAAKSIFEKFKDNPLNTIGLAQVAYAGGNIADGEKYLAEAIGKAKKKNWNVFVAAGDALVGGNPTGNVTNAIYWYKSALSENPQSIQALVGLANSVQIAKLPDADKIADSALNAAVTQQGKPLSSYALTKQGDFFLATNKVNEANASYKKSMALDATNPLNYRGIGLAFAANKENDSMKVYMDKFLANTDKATSDQIEYINSLYMGRNYAPVIDIVNGMIKDGKDKTMPSLYRILAYSQYETKDYTNALANINNFFVNDTFAVDKDAMDHVLKGKVYLALANQDAANKAAFTDSADKSINAAIAEVGNGSPINIYREAARVYYNEKDYPKANDWYEKVILDPSADKDDYWKWAVVSVMQNDYTTAASRFGKVYEKFPDYSDALYYQGYANLQSDLKVETGTAVPYFEKWLEVVKGKEDNDPANVGTANQYLTIWYFHKDDYPKASIYVNGWLAASPDNAKAQKLKTAIDKIQSAQEEAKKAPAPDSTATETTPSAPATDSTSTGK